MAVRFHPSGGESTDIVAVTLPCFFVKPPRDFLAMNEALRRGRFLPLQAVETLRFILEHPESWKALGRAFRKPPPSYANCRYNALHTFVWKDANGIQRYVRYSWRPADGEASLSRRESTKRPRDYLYQDLYDRLGR
jgi:catalase